MIGAFEFGWFALLMIWQRQTKRRHTDEIENPTGLNMAFRLRVPLRQHNDRSAWFFAVLDFCRKEPAPREVIFRRRCLDRAGPSQLITFEPIIRYRRQRIKVVAVVHYGATVLLKHFSRIITV